MDLLVQGFNIEHTDKIKTVANNSDEYTDRVRIEFKNGHELSIIRGNYSYGGIDGLFEIAPFDKNGNMNGDLFDDDDQGDSVLGDCTRERVIHYINKLGSL